MEETNIENNEEDMSLDARLNIINTIYGNSYPLNNGVCIIDNFPQTYNTYQKDLKIVNSFTAQILGTILTYKTKVNDHHVRYHGVLKLEKLVLIQLSRYDSRLYNELGNLIYTIPERVISLIWHHIKDNKLIITFCHSYTIIYNKTTHMVEEHFDNYATNYDFDKEAENDIIILKLITASGIIVNKRYVKEV